MSTSALKLSPDKTTLLLLTHAPHHSLTEQACDCAWQFCEAYRQLQPATSVAIPLQVFLYSEAVMLANRLIWLPADLPNNAHSLQQLAQKFDLTIQVCVSAALARGVTDLDNAKRHGLTNENLAERFSLVGLGELAMHLHQVEQVQQF